MHPRLTVLSSVFRGRSRLADDLEAFARGGAVRVGLGTAKLVEEGVEASLEAVRRHGLALTHVGHFPLVAIERGSPERDSEALRRSVEIAAAGGAGCVYGPSGGAPSLEWEQAAAAFAAAVAPVVPEARRRGIGLLVEPTISLVADLSFVHTLADTIELADRTGLGVCIDVQHCWHERGLRTTIGRAGERIGLVQLSDWVPGNRRHFRAVPGDGAIPLERILGWILETGYAGLFDLELYPEPGVPEHETIARGIERAGRLLDRLGV